MKTISWEQLQSMGNPNNVDEGTIDNDSKTQTNKGGKIRVYLEKKQRGGKKVSVIKGLDSSEDLKSLCKELKNSLGVGGAVKDEEIVLQGDQRKKLVEKLLLMGYTDVKNAGH